MKLTRRVLAVIVAAAMLVGVMAIGAYAATATSITTYGNYDAETNPYQAKIGLKVYRVDTETGEYTEITDGKVLNGEVIRVEVWGQTNYFASIANYIMAYSNSLFAPTKLDYSTYEYAATAAAGLGKEVIDKVAYDEDALTAAMDGEAENGYATYDAPYYFNTAATLNTSFAGADNASAINTMYPSAWKDASGNINTTGAAYNVLSAGYGPDVDLSLPASSNTGMNMAAVMSEYQPLVYFNLTVDGAAGDTGVVTLPEAAVRTSSNTSGRMYVSAGTPNDSYGDFGVGVEEAQACPSYVLNFSQYKDTYEDGTVADRVVDLSEGTVNFTVVSSLDGDEPVEPEVDKTALRTAIDTLPALTEDEADPDTWAAYETALAEATSVYESETATQDDVNAAEEALLAAIAGVKEKPAVAPELVALGDTIIDEERGFIYGLPHGDFGGVADLVDEGYVEVTGDGSVVCTPVDGNDLLGTGATVELLDSTGATVESYYVVIFGDTTGDGYITTDDLVDFEYWYAYLDFENDFEDFSNPVTFALDLDASGAVDTDDSMYVEYYNSYLIDDIYQTYEGQE